MNDKVNLDWEAIITVDKEDIGVNRFIVHGVNFELNQDLINLLQLKQLSENYFSLSKKQLKYWRNYLTQRCLTSGLKFTSYYSLNNIKQPVLQTLIYVDGQMTTYICRDLLERPQILPKICFTHAWLLNQILSQNIAIAQEKFLINPEILRLFIITFITIIIIMIIFFL
jgi:hypothetical protein